MLSTKIQMAAASSNELAPENLNCAPKFVPHCLLSSAFIRTPLSFPFSPHSKPTIITTVPNIIRHLHDSIFVRVNECFRQLVSSVTAGLHLFQKTLCFPTEFHIFRKIHCRDSGNLNSLSSHNFAAILPGDSVAGIVVTSGIMNFLNIYNTLLIVRLVLTWFPNSPPAIVGPLSTLCDPYLNIFRGIIPPLGGTLDLSPILAFLVLNAFTSAAAALPAELPSLEHLSSHTSFSNLTTTQKKWIRRTCKKGPRYVN